MGHSVYLVKCHICDEPLMYAQGKLIRSQCVCNVKHDMETNLERVQAYFKRQIVKGNYQIVEVTETHVNTWLSILVEDRPFVIKINQLEVIQEGCITENYLQLGEFSKEQQEMIIERLNGL